MSPLITSLSRGKRGVRVCRGVYVHEKKSFTFKQASLLLNKYKYC
jgi:hypothetical protein